MSIVNWAFSGGVFFNEQKRKGRGISPSPCSGLERAISLIVIKKSPHQINGRGGGWKQQSYSE